MKIITLGTLAGCVIAVAGTLALAQISAGRSPKGWPAKGLATSASARVPARPGKPPAAPARTLQSITVTPIYNPMNNGQPTVYVNATEQFTAAGNYSDGSTQYLTQSVAWASGVIATATIDQNGLATGVQAGTTLITATRAGIVGSFTLSVLPIRETGVVVAPAAISLQVGAARQFHAVETFTGYTIQDATSSATWTSSATNVATVSPRGLVTAVAAGSTMIQAVGGGLTGQTTLTVTAVAPANLGAWSQPYYMDIEAIHAILLNTGKVLMFTRPAGDAVGPTPAVLLDPVANAIARLDFPVPVAIVCAAHTGQTDGTVLIAGGRDDALDPLDAGITNTTFFNPVTQAFTQGAHMAYPRWYPSTVELASGETMVVSGYNYSGVDISRVSELYNPATKLWTALPASANFPPVTDDLYPMLFLLPNGNVFDAGPSQTSLIFNTVSNSWGASAKNNYGMRFHGAGVLLPSVMVMVVGGTNSPDMNSGTPTATAELISPANSHPAWSYTTPLNFARFNATLLDLPDGTVIEVGGNQMDKYGQPVEFPEVFDPVKLTWTAQVPQVAARGYHSLAVLLPDGRVMSAGSDSMTPLEKTYEFFSPSYLFKGPRPVITSAPTSLQYAQQFPVVTPDASTIARVALIRLASDTHATIFDQRFVDLAWSVNGDSITVTAPPSATSAPPGFYMLDLLNNSGVPAVMPIVLLQ
jgi:hypothetical protein